MPRPTFHNLPADKRRRIEEAAIQEFSERQYSLASISSIVARAGIAKGSFYQYFDGKIDLFRWLVLHVVARKKVAAIVAIPPAPGGFWATFSHMLLGAIRFGLQNPRLARISAVLWYPSADPELQRLYEEFQLLARQNMRMLLEQGRQVGALRQDLDLDVASDFLLVMLQQGLDLAMRRRIGMDLMEFCANPQAAERFPEREQLALLTQHLDLLQRAIGQPQPNGAPAGIDIQKIAARFLSDVSHESDSHPIG